MKITNHHELRRDVSIDCSTPVLTDQSFKNACDINVIMANYAKTGMLSNTVTLPQKFIDNTLVPSLENAYDIVFRAEEAFYNLPPDIRRLMDNDPSQLEQFINNPKNANMLLEHGVIIEQKEAPLTDTQTLTKAISGLTEKITTKT